MSVLPVGFGSSGGYIIENSVRLRASASAYFSKTFGSVGDRKTWTFHIRCKRGSLGSYQRLLSDSTNSTYLRFDTSDRLEWNYHDGISSNANTSTRKFRDPTAWLDIVLSCDTTQATSTNRWKIEVNGETLSAWDVGPSYTGTLNNAGCSINNNTAHYISGYAGTGEFFDGVVADIHFIGGARLAASDFGETNADGVWVPKPYTGTYGANGFKLDFADAAVTSGSNAGLGKDTSGNGNYWNTNNISVTAGVTYDAFVDTPTNNYATISPWAMPVGSVASGGLAYTRGSTASHGSAAGSIPLPTTGSWCWEVIATNSVNAMAAGVADAKNGLIPVANEEVGRRASYTDYAYRSDGNKWSANSSAAYGAAYTSGDVLGFVWDADAQTLTAYKNGTTQGTMYSSITQEAGRFFPCASVAETGYVHFNFGQRPLAHSYGSAKTLCTANLSAVAIKQPNKHFDAVTRTGNGASYTNSSLQFQPDFVWDKSRSVADHHFLQDVCRGFGASKSLSSSATGAEGVQGGAPASQSFSPTSTGFTLGASDTDWNANGTAKVDWLWKAGGTPTTDNVAGAGNTPTAGSVKIDGANLGSALAGTIAATRLSANTTAGFSAITFAAPASGTGTIAHGLGVAPALVIVKSRAIADSFWVWHKSLSGASYDLAINSTAAESNTRNVWNSTAPTSSVFSIGTYLNGNGNSVAYCFAEVPGYSKFGSYVGNGSTDGPFVFCGFRPRFILVKRSDAGAENWLLWDSSRMTYNVSSLEIKANLANAEADVAAANGWDQTSNGFKLRSGNSIFNTSTATYIYAAFAEHPFGGSNCAPAPAR